MFHSQNPLPTPPLSLICTSVPSVDGVCPDSVGALRKSRSLIQTDPPIRDAQKRPQPLSAHALPNTFRHTGDALPPKLKTDSRFSAFSPLATHHSPLSSVESAVPQNAPITLLESALPETQHLKSFRIRTYGKRWGEGGKLLTRNPYSRLRTTYYPLLTPPCTLYSPPSPSHHGATPHV